MANNPQNLKRLTSEEARKIGKLGGKKSVEARKTKKTLKEMFEIAIDIYTKKALSDPNISEEQRSILNDTNILVLETIKTAINNKVKYETRLKASDMIMDRIYGKPKQETINTNLNTDIDLSSVPTENLEFMSRLSATQLQDLLKKGKEIKK